MLPNDLVRLKLHHVLSQVFEPIHKTAFISWKIFSFDKKGKPFDDRGFLSSFYVKH